jgi:uncharacterized protein
LPEPSQLQPEPRAPLRMHELFLGSDGLRAGWGVLLFVLLSELLRAMLYPLAGSFLPRTPKPSSSGMDPLHTIVFEAVGLLCVVISTWVLARIEGRPPQEYGLLDPLRWRHIAAGALSGIVLLSALVLWLRLQGALVFDGWQSSGFRAWRFGAVWLCVFILVGFFEELLFRGYVLFTISRAVRTICDRFRFRHSAGIGFAVATLLTSFCFAFVHGANPGESPIGLASAGLIALVFCFSVWRTGSLWWAIGFHTAWDWMQSFFFGVGDSGSIIQGRLLASHTAGRTLLSGGATGPEGSILVFPIVIATACIVAFTLPRQVGSGPQVPYRTGRSVSSTGESLH